MIVTGSSSGIGQSIAWRLGRAGARVAGIDIADPTETAARLGDFRNFTADASDTDDVRLAFEAIDRWFAGPPDALVCCAGIAPEGALVEMSPATFDRIMAVNVRGPFLCASAAARRMIAAGRPGRIVMITSTSAEQAFPQIGAYGASKGALKLLMMNLAIELAPHGIAVNAVGPGTVHTPLSQAGGLADEQWAAAELGNTPLGRFGQPEEIAQAVHFLLEHASWMTGQTLYVDGGFLACGVPARPEET